MHKSGFINVNGARLFYEEAGEGETLVLLHSGYTDLRLWDYQFESFIKNFRVVRYDIRGFGKSDRPKQSFSHFEDLKELFDQLKIDKAHLVGVSMGGSIAIDFTLQYPDLVDCLVLSGPSLNGYKPVIDEASQQRSVVGLSIVKRDVNFINSVEFMVNDLMWKQNGPTAREHLRTMFLDTSLSWLLDDNIKVETIQAAERLTELCNRTLLIIGSNDSQPIKEIGKVLESKITNIVIAKINNTGHLPNLDKPEIFNNIVIDFLKIENRERA